MNIDNYINELNKIYAIQEPISYDSLVWEKFGKLVLDCKKSGISFCYYSFDENLYDKIKLKPKEIDSDNEKFGYSDSIEAITYSIKEAEKARTYDNLCNEHLDYRRILKTYILELKRDRDYLYAELTFKTYFTKLDENTISYSLGLNPVYDYKIEYYINKQNEANINNQLKLIYEPYIKELKKLPINERENLSYPLLMNVFNEYESIKRRVLYVGKETNGWIGILSDDEDLSVNYIMECYTEFEFAKDYHGRNSSFWRFVRTFHNKVNDGFSEKGILWTNFSKCDSNRTTPDENLQKLNEAGFDLILKEIEIVKPDIILFLTGWVYEPQFQRVFKGLEYDTIEEDYLYKCVHKSLPENTFMTMHPKALQLRNKFEGVIDQILGEIKTINA